jgi:hypothetical protein
LFMPLAPGKCIGRSSLEKCAMSWFGREETSTAYSVVSTRMSSDPAPALCLDMAEAIKEAYERY